jgi:acylphosphatase
VRVSGRVQGVFFRAWTQQQANELGVTGWVRNAADGSVEAHLAGEESAVQQLIERLHDGPPSAIVSKVNVSEAEPENINGLEVRP